MKIESERIEFEQSKKSGSELEQVFVPLSQSRQQSLIRFADLISAIVTYRVTFLVVLLLTVLVPTAATFLMPKVYRAETLMAPATAGETPSAVSAIAGQLSGLPGIAALGLGSSASKDEALAILRSRDFTFEFMESEDILPILFLNRWNRDLGDWEVADPQDVPTLWDGYQLFDRKVRQISVIRDTGFVVLAVEWTDRELAANWTNRLAARLNARMRAMAIDEANKSIEYLNGELEKTSIVELRAAIFELIENQINKIMLANVRDEYAFKILDKARVPDVDDYVRPKRLLIFVGAMLVGIILALITVVVRYFWKAV